MKKEEKEAKQIYNESAENLREIGKGWFFKDFLETPAVLELLGNVKNKKVLDFGCGVGHYTKRLIKQGAKVKGFDISEGMVKIALEESPNADLKVGSGYKIPFNEKFDVVIAPLVLHYLSDWDKVFKEVKRVLKKEGVFIFSGYNPVLEVLDLNFKNKKFEFEGNYFKKEKIWKKWEHANKKDSIFFYHKSYEEIINTILKNKFEIVGYKDTFPLKKSEKLYSKSYNKWSKLPKFSVWKVKKK